ncbi:MAG: response regulator [Syntrophales bacterium]|nr:response regulator [Syntrophales bacterium]
MNQENAPFLVVDDEPEMCWILENILKKNGFTCHTALNAQEAIALTERQPFRMAFLDAKLPDIDGLKLARRLRKFAPRLPIVIVSGYFYQDDATIEGALKSGLIAAFISKPFIHDEIARVINLHADDR